MINQTFGSAPLRAVATRSRVVKRDLLCIKRDLFHDKRDMRDRSPLSHTQTHTHICAARYRGVNSARGVVTHVYFNIHQVSFDIKQVSFDIEYCVIRDIPHTHPHTAYTLEHYTKET
jgi:hypothetical protein